MYRHIPLAVAMMFIVGCEPQLSATSSEADRAAVEEASEVLIAALNANDIDGILAGLTPGHVTMAPNEPVLPNGPVLRPWHEARIAAVDAKFEITTDSMVVAGDWAIQRWRSKVTATPRDGSSSTSDSLKGIWVWQRQTDGGWKLDCSIWNSDNPVDGT